MPAPDGPEPVGQGYWDWGKGLLGAVAQGPRALATPALSLLPAIDDFPFPAREAPLANEFIHGLPNLAIGQIKIWSGLLGALLA